MKLIIGLGNPGKRYEKTRHNVGFLVLDLLHKKLSQNNTFSDWSLSNKFNAEISGGTIKGEKIFLAKPMTFMNDSGITVQLIAKYYKVPVSEIIVVHDDKDIILGEVRLQENRGHAGHNGVKSIMELLKTKTFQRIRLGIGNEKKQNKIGTTDFVLGKFGVFEKKDVNMALEKAVVHILSILKT